MSWLLSLAAAICIQMAIGTPTPRLMFIGTYSSTSYFYDNSIRDWKSSGAFCNSIGMKIAEFYDSGYLGVIDAASKANPQQIPKGQLYWTNGRESLTISKFVWNNTDPRQVPSFYFDAGDVIAPTTCLAYGMQLHFTGRPCKEKLPVLCQTV